MEAADAAQPAAQRAQREPLRDRARAPGNKHIVRDMRQPAAAPARFRLESFGAFAEHVADWRAKYVFFPDRRDWTPNSTGAIELRLAQAKASGTQNADDLPCASAIRHVMQSTPYDEGSHGTAGMLEHRARREHHRAEQGGRRA